MAAGLTLRAAALEAFRAAFDAEVRRWMTLEDAIGIVHSDGPLSGRERTIDVVRLLQAGGPWGQAFPEPVFDDCFQVRATRIVGERHLRLDLQDGDGGLCEAIAFRHFDDADAPEVKPDARVELAYRLDVNQYNGLEKVQLVVEYLRVL
jgi:single-stranded-DNA-specific exonuclease